MNTPTDIPVPGRLLAGDLNLMGEVEGNLLDAAHFTLFGMEESAQIALRVEFTASGQHLYSETAIVVNGKALL